MGVHVCHSCDAMALLCLQAHAIWKNFKLKANLNTCKVLSWIHIINIRNGETFAKLWPIDYLLSPGPKEKKEKLRRTY